MRVVIEQDSYTVALSYYIYCCLVKKCAEFLTRSSGCVIGVYLCSITDLSQLISWLSLNQSPEQCVVTLSPDGANSLTLSFWGTVNVLLFLTDLSFIGSGSSSPTVSIISLEVVFSLRRHEYHPPLTRQKAAHSGAAILFWSGPSDGQPRAFPEF